MQHSDVRGRRVVAAIFPEGMFPIFACVAFAAATGLGVRAIGHNDPPDADMVLARVYRSERFLERIVVWWWQIWWQIRGVMGIRGDARDNLIQ